MAKGHKTGGRAKGTPNKSTAEVREAMARFAEANIPRLEEWIGRVAETDPGKAADLTLKAIEYHIPKLSRAEVTGENGGPVSTISEIVIKAVDP